MRTKSWMMLSVLAGGVGVAAPAVVRADDVRYQRNVETVERKVESNTAAAKDRIEDKADATKDRVEQNADRAKERVDREADAAKARLDRAEQRRDRQGRRVRDTRPVADVNAAKERVEDRADAKKEAIEERSERAKERAEQNADRAKDRLDRTEDRVDGEVDKPRRGEVVVDPWVTTKVKTKILADESLRRSEINVDTTNDGVVTLHGTVPTAAAKARAVQLARETDGVRSVNDKLRVGPRTDDVIDADEKVLNRRTTDR